MSFNPSDHPTMASRTPLRIGAYGLRVRDLEGVARFYERIVGLTEMAREGERITLGNDGAALLVLERAPEAVPDDPKSAGLFHTAFLMPTRADLANWLLHARRHGITITRASDHAVNEAIYFDDPEGNGVECYADRPQETWVWENGAVYIPSTPVDLGALARAADSTEPWAAPKGMRIGHINLRVGDLDAAEAFYGRGIGMDLTCRRDPMTFLSSGGYHHHMAANTFTSAGAGPRDEGRAGLSWFTIEAADMATLRETARRLREFGAPLRDDGHGIETRDPWGTRVRVFAAA